MHHFFTIWIKIYWLIFAERNRNICLYKESCSKKIFRKFIENGILSGIYTFYERLKNCRSSYKFIIEKEEIKIITKTGKIIENIEINPYILNQYIKQNIKEL